MAMIAIRSTLALATGVLVLTGCASVADDGFPSLARRDAERLTGSAIPADGADALPPPPSLSADLETRVGQLLGQARRAHDDFEQRRGRAGSLVGAASGAARASESWVSAQVALADLQSARSDTMIALAELDELFARERLAYSDAISPGAALVEEARETVEILVAEEDSVIAAYASRLR